MAVFRALVADDHSLFRAGVRLLLEDAFGIEVTEVGSFDAALESITAKPFDLASFDLDMPGMAGVITLRIAREACPGLKIVVMSAHEGRDDILGALGSGANGYIPKSHDMAQIEAAFRVIVGGGVYVPSLVTALDRPAAAPQPAAGAASSASSSSATLSPRQREVLAQLGQGRSTKEIARSLDLAEATVKVHLAAVYRFLGARNRAEAVAMAARRNDL